MGYAAKKMAGAFSVGLVLNLWLGVEVEECLAGGTGFGEYEAPIFAVGRIPEAVFVVEGGNDRWIVIVCEFV